MTKPAPPFRPIVVNLDGIGRLLDKALAHPLAGLVAAAAPELHGAIVEAREDLTGVAAHLVGEAHEAVMGEVDRTLAKAIRKATGKRKRPKRLKA